MNSCEKLEKPSTTEQKLQKPLPTKAFLAFHRFHLSHASDLTFSINAAHKWIAREIWQTCTDWIVINDATQGIIAASSRTGILATFVDARFVLSTFGAAYTFRPTIGWSSNIIGNTRANSMTVYRATNTILAAWRGFAGIRGYNWIV